MSAHVSETSARVRAAGGAELAHRLEHLDRTWTERRTQPKAAPPKPPAPNAGDRVDADVVIAGGGLWSLLAPLLAERGLSVWVFDRARAAQAHREWNASAAELAALVRVGLVGESELSDLIVARYDYGTCRFQGGVAHPVHGVLDCAVDASKLLTLGRKLGEARGVRYLDGASIGSLASGGGKVRAVVGDVEHVTARVLVDARGAASPFASADLVCPTVGGVLRGLREGPGADEIDPRVGEILATVDGVDAAGRQHVWEGFPGRAGETTVYLFYYAHASEPATLTDLYARFFAELPSYKRGDAQVVRPTFGFIPGWSRLTPAPRAPEDRVVLVGDAAARHSPLTYCGFGATLRSLAGARDAITEAVADPSWRSRSIVDDAPAHSLTGALAHLLASRSFRGDALNRLLDASFTTLAEMGEAHYAALLRDEMAPADVVTFLRRTARRHPAVWSAVLSGLGPRAAGRWTVNVARSLF